MQRRYVVSPLFVAALSILLLCEVMTGLPSRALERGPDDWEAHWNEKQPPDKVMDAIGIEPGMIIAEIGAGKGRYAVKVAARVGCKGKVYANDIDTDKLDYLQLRCERDSITNIETLLGEEIDPRLPAGKLDFVYCINTYHHLEKPVPLLTNTKPALKPTGHLVIIEHDPEKSSMGGHATPSDTVLAHATAAGFELIEIKTFLELDNIYIFRVNQ